jgi:hypothetical protein
MGVSLEGETAVKSHHSKMEVEVHRTYNDLFY